MSDVVARLLMLASGRSSPLAGQWVAEYDPTRPGVGVNGTPGAAHLVCVSDPAGARRFANQAQAWAYLRRPSGRIRPDGQPDRPVTAFHLAVFPIDDDGRVHGADTLSEVVRAATDAARTPDRPGR